MITQERGIGGSTSNKKKHKKNPDLVTHAIFMGSVFSQGCKQTFVTLKEARRVSFIKI